MKKRIFSLFSALMIAVLIFSPAGAAGSVKLSASWSLGSLIAQGYASGLGKTDVNLVLEASGPAAIICTNNGENDVPGQSYPKVLAYGLDTLPGSDPLRKNGRAPFYAETVDPTDVTWEEGGCPNSNWTARIDFIFWDHATIYVYDLYTNVLLTKVDYICTTTRTTVKCTPVK